MTPLVHPSASSARFFTGQELACELYDGVLASVGAVDLWVMTPYSLVGYTEAVDLWVMTPCSLVGYTEAVDLWVMTPCSLVGYTEA